MSWETYQQLRRAAGDRPLRLSKRQREAFEHVAQGERPCGRSTTWDSLARLGLFEHTSTGWRLTELGIFLARHMQVPGLAAQYREAE